MSSPAWWRSTRPTWEVPGATGAWQSVFRARSGAVEPLSKLSLGSCVEVAWCGRTWYLTWKPRRCCRSCTNACNVAPSSARTPLPATRASQRGATSTGLWVHSQAFSDRQGSHVNGLEGFWGYLKRRLAAKGGVRRERLPLYLAEYVWRYNHRRLSGPEQVKTLFKLLQS